MTTPNPQLELDFEAAQARDDDTPFAEWIRNQPRTPWSTYDSQEVTDADRDRH